MGALCSCVECVEDAPELTPEELAAYEAEEAAYKKPPCQECGAMTQEEAAKKCNCAGDKDYCHGTILWPD